MQPCVFDSEPARQTRNYCSNRNGFLDRANGLAPQSSDADYFRGYCERLCFEIDLEAMNATQRDLAALDSELLPID